MGDFGDTPLTDRELDRWLAEQTLLQQVGQRIVVGVDPAGIDADSLRWAGDQADLNGVGVTLLVVHGPTSRRFDTEPSPELLSMASAQAFQLLDTARRQLTKTHPTLDVQTVAINDDRLEVLQAVTGCAAMTVLGASSLRTLHGRLFGGTVGAVSATADGPVAVVPDHYAQRLDGPVTLGVDLSGSSVAAMEYAAASAVSAGAELHLVFAWGLSRYTEAGRLDEEIWLSRTSSRTTAEALETIAETLRVRFPRLAVRVLLIEGEADSVLTQRALVSRQLVIGSRGLCGLHAWLARSTSRAVLRRCQTPVIVVPDASRRIARAA